MYSETCCVVPLLLLQYVTVWFLFKGYMCASMQAPVSWQLLFVADRWSYRKYADFSSMGEPRLKII